MTGKFRSTMLVIVILTEMPPLTVENYRLLPETGPRYQLIEGDLYMAPAPNRYHQEISRNLELILGNYLKKNPLGKIYDAPFDVYLDQTNVFQPDILYVSESRYSILTPEGAEGAPNLIVEILSPRTARLDLHNKRRQYARHGVEELWIIDPVPRTLSVHRFHENSEEPVQVLPQSGQVSTPHFPDLIIDLSEVFAE